VAVVVAVVAVVAVVGVVILVIKIVVEVVVEIQGEAVIPYHRRNESSLPSAITTLPTTTAIAFHYSSHDLILPPLPGSS